MIDGQIKHIDFIKRRIQMLKSAELWHWVRVYEGHLQNAEELLEKMKTSNNEIRRTEHRQ